MCDACQKADLFQGWEHFWEVYNFDDSGEILWWFFDYIDKKFSHQKL